MQALKFGWNSVFTADTVPNAQGVLRVSVEAVERIIDRKRGMLCDSSDGALATCAATAGGAFVDAQCSNASFDIHQPLVSTRLLNGSALDETTAEDDVEAIAASWNKSRFASRVGLERPVAWCAFCSHAVSKFFRSFLNDIFL
jgi:hypothetical protein